MNYEKTSFTTKWGVEVKTCFRPDTNDWNTLYSCLIDDEYLVGTLDEPVGKQIAIDIGAHAGGCSLALLSRGYFVIAVEPLPENAELILMNVKENGWEGRFMFFNNAIHSEFDRKVILRYGNENTESGFHHRFIGNTIDSSDWQENLWTEGREIAVKTITLDYILKNIETVEFLKIDCEGAEWEAFRNPLPETVSKIKKIAAELHHAPGVTNIYKDFHKLIGEEFQDKTLVKYGDIQSQHTIGLAYFEK